MIEKDNTSEAGKCFGPSNHGTETILVVEGENVIRTLICRILQSHGYTVLKAGNCGEALAICEQHDGPIHLLFADIVLSPLSGPQLAERLRPLRPDLKILFTSGRVVDIAAKHRGLNAAFIRKPFSQEELQRKVQQVLHVQ
jgi:CheY-like chemotaxis protein